MILRKTRTNFSSLFSLVLTLMICLLSLSGFAAEQYRPPIAKFDGNNSLNFPADPSLHFSDYGTIEFWVAATWDNLDYDPVVLSYHGDMGPRFSVFVGRDRQGLGVVGGSSWDALQVDLSNGRLHHVALIFIGDKTEVIVDGQTALTLSVGVADLPAHSFVIGSLNGTDAGFPGALAGLRIWDTPLDPDDLEAYKLVDLTSPEGLSHPSIDSLVGFSDFADGRKNFVLNQIAE